MLPTYAARWTLAVACHATQQHLGFGHAHSQAPAAVQRTAPGAALVSSLVLLWAAQHVQQGGTLGWLARPWYRPKTAPAFPDLLSALHLQQDLWRHRVSAPPWPTRRPQKAAPPTQDVQPLAA